MAAVATFYRNIGLSLPENLSLRPYNEADNEFIDYLLRSDIKDKVYIAETPVISKYGTALEIAPSSNNGIGIEIANATQQYYRASMKNVQSCHAECQMHRGGQLAYLQNPFWRQVTWYKPVADNPDGTPYVHKFRTDYTDPANYRGGYLKSAIEFIKLQPYKSRNLIATANIIPMLTETGELYFCLSRAYGDNYVQYGKLIEKILETYPGVGIALIKKHTGNWTTQVQNNHLPAVLIPFRKEIASKHSTIMMYGLPAIANFGNDKSNIYRYPDIAPGNFVNVLNKDDQVVTIVKEKHECIILIPNTQGAILTGYNPTTTLDQIVKSLHLKTVDGVVTDGVTFIGNLVDYMAKITICAITGRQISEEKASKYTLSDGTVITYETDLTKHAHRQMYYESDLRMCALSTHNLVLRVSLRNQLTPTITVGGSYSQSGNNVPSNRYGRDKGWQYLLSEVTYSMEASPTSMGVIATKATGLQHSSATANGNTTVSVTYNLREILEDNDAKVMVLGTATTLDRQLMSRPLSGMGCVSSSWTYFKVLGYYFAVNGVYSMTEVSRLLGMFDADDRLSKEVGEGQYQAYKMLLRLAKAGRLKEYTTPTINAIKQNKSLLKLPFLRSASIRLGINATDIYELAYHTPAPIQATVVNEPTQVVVDDALLEAFGVGHGAVVEEVVA